LSHVSLSPALHHPEAQVFPDILGAPKAGGMALHGTELTRWLRRL
jgi:hypothetical protein